MRALLKWFGAALLLLLAVVLLRTLLLPSHQLSVRPYAQETIDPAKAARDLSGAIPFRTVSYQETGDEAQRAQTAEAFSGLHAYLEKTFPAVYENLEHQVIGANNLLFAWKGSDPSRKPVLLMGHQDVVPIEPGTEAQWTRGAFSGDIADGFIWGRGTLDDKVSVIGVLEAVEFLLARGFRPRRTVYLAFGQDEEIGGLEGARKVAQFLQAHGVQLEFVLDEGGFVTRGMVPGVSAPVAMVGTAEKGYLTLELRANVEGGHSSMPPAETSIGIVSAAVQRVESSPMPAHVRGPIGELLEYAAGSATFPTRMVYRNLWLFGPVVQRILQRSPGSNAALRTTTAPTIFQAGNKENVLPRRASAVINFRLLPGDTASDVIAHVRSVIHDPRVSIQTITGPAEASPRSRADSPNFVTVQRTIAQVFPGAVVAPYVSIGATDAKHFTSLSPDVYRFLPISLEREDLVRIHGVNERIPVDGFARSVAFYAQLLRNAAE